MFARKNKDRYEDPEARYARDAFNRHKDEPTDKQNQEINDLGSIGIKNVIELRRSNSTAPDPTITPESNN